MEEPTGRAEDSPGRRRRRPRRRTGARRAGGLRTPEGEAGGSGPSLDGGRGRPSLPPRRPVPRDELDRRVRELLGLTEPTANTELLEAILQHAARLPWEDVSRLDLKILNGALRELRRSFRVFAPFRGVPKITIFGSARTAPDHPLYRLAEETAALFVREGHMIITGAGPGVMAAANRGAGFDAGFGLAIRLPFEPLPNPWVHADRLVNFKYFFTRKLFFIKESAGFLMLPGGFGTNDECFELLTLLQTGKAEPKPVVLLDLREGTYWHGWLDFVRRELADPGYVDAADLSLLTIAHTPEAALQEIASFYRVYHSSRNVGDRLMLRLKRPLTEAELAELNAAYADIITQDPLEPCGPPAEDQLEPELLGLHRVWFHFNRRSYARLRGLIDAINRLG